LTWFYPSGKVDYFFQKVALHFGMENIINFYKTILQKKIFLSTFPLDPFILQPLPIYTFSPFSQVDSYFLYIYYTFYPIHE